MRRRTLSDRPALAMPPGQRLILALLAMSLSLAVSSFEAAAQESQPVEPKLPVPTERPQMFQRPDTLICRGGGENGLVFHVAAEFVELRMLHRSSQPATAGLAPGQCGFADRVFQAQDPLFVRFWEEDPLGRPKIVGIYVTFGAWSDCGPNNLYQVKCTWTNTNAAVEGRELLGWLQDLLDPAKQWVLRVKRYEGRMCPGTPCWRLIGATPNPSPVPERP